MKKTKYREFKFRVWDKDKINVRKGSKGMYKQRRLNNETLRD